MGSFSLLCVLGLIFTVGNYVANAQDSQTDFVNAHNAARSQVGVSNIVWDNTVAAYAQNYANQRKDCNGVHSGGRYGENIAKSYGGDLSGTAAVKLWVVWRNSVRLGCAKVTCDNGGTFVTCNYDPPGNYADQRPY
ncbi:unnamed protein product [Vicia faba]|uniref:SCP domain-containing protein n=1 Tax=Vicia faba TaxID=3906 RepID=A0AAV0YYJ6_VICFA|nr:unnamed protein product [Vicia faba]